MRETAHGGVFVDFHEEKLPIDIMRIAKASGIHVVKDSDVHVLQGEYGRIYYKDKKWLVVYDDTHPREIKRYIIAHELGHMFLAHNITKIKYTIRGKDKFQEKPSEDHANSFADRILCPSCVIWAAEMNSAEEIAKYCDVDMALATRRHKRMETLRKRNKFLTSPIERELFNCFLPYINSIRKSKGLSMMEEVEI